MRTFQISVSDETAPQGDRHAVALAQDPDSVPTFCGIVYSGGPLPGYTAVPRLDYDYVLDLAGLKPMRNIVANLDHVRNQRVGHVAEFNNDGKRVEIAGLLSCQTRWREEVLGSARNGFRWELSLEAGSMDSKTFIPDGQTVTVNGRQLAGPLYVFRNSTFAGLAFVTQGADEGNQIRVAASGDLENYILSCGFDPAAMAESQVKYFGAEFALATAVQRQRRKADKETRRAFWKEHYDQLR